VNSDGRIEFLAPAGFPKKMADKLIAENPDLLNRLQKKAEAKLRHKRVWQEGMTVFFFGSRVPVKFSRRCHFFNGETILIPAGDENSMRENLIKLYRETAKAVLTNRTKELAGKFGISYTRVLIGSAGSRWGCCSKSGNIRYSWKLLQCSNELIEYVIIHELAHRLVFDHSEKFWMQVKAMLPDFEERRRELKIFARNPELL
ncbi:MAG: M48 family metallopeptidase, partial [Lentisphaeria bacterium]|nr:M48 family metallopeptidase [Lentisphaeria bacterium]